MIEIVTTAESVDQAEALLDAGVDTLQIGNEKFGLRLPASFSLSEIETITKLAHARGRKVSVVMNALMHNEHIGKITPYLQQIKDLEIDSIVVGDPGVIHLLQKHSIDVPFIYDAQTMVTSARQVNFWQKRGAIGAVLARELTFIELKQIAEQVEVPIEVLVYGATCIHQSKRPLVDNYFNFTEQTEDISKERGLFLSEPKRPDTHYSVYEDLHGTHIFATDDIELSAHLKIMADAGLTQWKLDGVFTKGDAFVQIAASFVEAKERILQGEWTPEFATAMHTELVKWHPENRTMNEGFFLKDPSDVQ